MRVPPAGTPLCPLDALPDPGARGFVFGAGTERFEMFIVRRGGEVRGFVNACPHQGTPLELFADRFLTPDGMEIVCATHGARFAFPSGDCVAGPCRGRALLPIAIGVDDDMIRIIGY